MKKPIILCVDDEQMVLSSLKSQLKRHLGTDYAVETVDSGDEAIEVFKELTEDGYDVPLVISDQIMPGMKGDEFLTAIHLISEDVVKVLLTGQASAEAVGNAVNNAKLYRYIEKPWEIQDLNMTVSEAINRFFQARELAEKNKQLQETLATLEEKIVERTSEIEQQRKELEQKNKDITDSINYAKLIQDAMLPDAENIKLLLPHSFVIFKPKDIVSGDFFWLNFNEEKDKFYFAVADSTGHGIPGAFMSLIGNSLFNAAVNTQEFISPDVVLNSVRDGIIKNLNQKGGDQKDGMDAALISYDKMEMVLRYSGANNPLYILRRGDSPLYNLNGELQESCDCSDQNVKLYDVSGCKQPLAFHPLSDDFKLHEFQMIGGDEIYMFSDGYVDQFGGDKNKKFRHKQFKNLLIKNFGKNHVDQENEIEKVFESWKGDFEQIDDVCVFGAKL